MRGGGVRYDDGTGTPEESGGDGGGEASIPARGDVYVGEGSIGVEALGAEDGGEDEVANAAGFERAGGLVEVEFH